MLSRFLMRCFSMRCFSLAGVCLLWLCWWLPREGYPQDPVFMPPQRPPSGQSPADPPSAMSAQTARTPDSPQAIFFPPRSAGSAAQADRVPPTGGLPPDIQPPAGPPAQVAPLPAAAAPVNLPRKITTKIDETIIPALQSGQQFVFLSGMYDLIGKQSRETLESIEVYAQSQGVSINRHFADLLMSSIEREEQLTIPDLRIDAVEYINQGIRERINQELDELAGHHVMQPHANLPDSWRECEQLFWEMHVWNNRLHNLLKLADYGVAIQQRLLQRAARSGDQALHNRLQPPLLTRGRVVQAIQSKIEGETRLRIAELKKAEQTLRANADVKAQISAAFALELHHLKLTELFSQYPPGSFLDANLNDPSLPESCRKLVESGRTAGGPIVPKAMLLRQGAHWWLRGRYGAGPLAFGLLKAKSALRSDEAMFGLYMPIVRPTPIGLVTSENTLAPGFDRRHFYTWAIERRDLVSNASVNRGRTDSEVTIAGSTPVAQRSFW